MVSWNKFRIALAMQHVTACLVSIFFPVHFLKLAEVNTRSKVDDDQNLLGKRKNKVSSQSLKALCHGWANFLKLSFIVLRAWRSRLFSSLQPIRFMRGVVVFNTKLTHSLSLFSLSFFLSRENNFII